MKKGLNAWTVDSGVNFEEMFAQLKDAGFDGVELNVDSSGSSAHSLTMETTKEQLRTIRQASEKHSLPIISISTSLYNGKMGSPHSEDRKYVNNLMRKQLACAQALGADGILCVPGGAGSDGGLRQDHENSLEALRSLRPMIQDFGLRVDVENVWNGFFTSPFHMAQFIDGADCSLVGAYFDVGNVIAFSWAESWIEVLGRRIHHVHVKDFKRCRGLNSGGEFVDLGQGDVNWAGTMKALAQAGFDGFLTGEVFKNDPTLAYEDYYAGVVRAMKKILTVKEDGSL